jgi:hypothetical protein
MHVREVAKKLNEDYGGGPLIVGVAVHEKLLRLCCAVAVLCGEIREGKLLVTEKHLEWADEFAKMDVDAFYVAHRYPRLFYLWGHSFEFDNNNNWELLDAICGKLSHLDNTWYATNMEIYEYVTAYQSLIFSADNRRVYNPTLITIWYDEDGTLYKIEPGETQVRE